MWKHKSRNVGSLQKLEIKETVLLSFDKELELTLKYFNDILWWHSYSTSEKMEIYIMHSGILDVSYRISDYGKMIANI